MSKQAAVVLVSVVLWVLLWMRPAAVMPFAFAAGMWLCGLIVVGATRHQRRGWGSGVLFAVILLTLPAWIGVLLEIYQNR